MYEDGNGTYTSYILSYTLLLVEYYFCFLPKNFLNYIISGLLRQTGLPLRKCPDLLYYWLWLSLRPEHRCWRIVSGIIETPSFALNWLNIETPCSAQNWLKIETPCILYCTKLTKLDMTLPFPLDIWILLLPYITSKWIKH